jgi:hypothetical protein
MPKTRVKMPKTGQIPDKKDEDRGVFTGFRDQVDSILARVPVIEALIKKFEAGMGQEMDALGMTGKERFDVYFQLIKFYNDSLNVARKVIAYYGTEVSIRQRRILRAHEKLSKRGKELFWKRLMELKDVK